MKLYINKISENNSEYIELKEGKILIHREKIDPLLQVAVGDVVIFVVFRTSRCYFSVLEKADLNLKFKIMEEFIAHDSISFEEKTMLLFDSDGENDVKLLQDYYTRFANLFQSISVKTILFDINEIVNGNEDKLSYKSIIALFDPNYQINEADLIIEKTVPERINNQNEMQDANINNEKAINSSNVKEFNVLNIKLNDKEDKIKKKTIVYFVFLFDKVISFDKNRILNSDLEALVSCNESSLVFWFDELYIYISRKEGVRHKIYYKISRSNISSNYNRLIVSLCIENKSYYQFSSESFFLYEYVMTRRDDSFSNFKEDVFLDELFKIVKKHLCDNNIAIIQKHLVKEIIPSITDNEFSVFESQEIRDVCCYLLGKGFSKISVLNSIRELSPFDYYSAIQKNKISLASSTFNTNEDEEIIINKELAILQSELNQINEIKNPIKFLDDNIQLHIYSIKDNLNISEEAVFNNIVKVIYPKDYDSSIKQYNEKLSRKNEIEKLIKVLNFKLGNHIVNPSAIKKKEISNNELKSKTKNDIPYIRNQGYKLSFLDVEYSSFLTNTYVQSKSSIFIFVNPADQDDYLYDQINNKHIIKGQGLVGNQHFGSNINDQILKHRRNDIKVFLFKKNNNTSDCLFIDQIRYYSHSFEEEYLKNKRRWVIKFVFKSI